MKLLAAAASTTTEVGGGGMQQHGVQRAICRSIGHGPRMRKPLIMEVQCWRFLPP